MLRWHLKKLFSNHKVVVCGAGGFIGHHLVNRLVDDGYWVRGVDLKYPEFVPTRAHDFLIGDLRDNKTCREMFLINHEYPEIDVVFQLAADMGGMGHISSAEYDIMKNNVLINANVLDAVADAGVVKMFFSSSVCVYPDMKIGDPMISEDDAYPAFPDNEYGWEKLYSERLFMATGKELGIDVRIARFQNCYGPLGTWRGGREKAPAALSRKIAMAKDGELVEVWGSGTAVRPFVHVNDLIDGIMLLMDSHIDTPVNIGPVEGITVNQLAGMLINISGKKLGIKNVDGPVGVETRRFDNKKIKSLGWDTNISLTKGLRETYEWVNAQVVNAQYE